MAAKIVSQKKFSKLVASTGSLSQPPGALPRMSNLLFTQRGSLQIANGSFALPTPTPEGPVPAPSYTLSISSFTKNNPTLGLGQFPPVMTLIEQLIVPTQVGAFLTAITTAGPGPNPAGYYLFAVVTMDMSGGTTSVGWTGGFPWASALALLLQLRLLVSTATYLGLSRSMLRPLLPPRACFPALTFRLHG